MTSAVRCGFFVSLIIHDSWLLSKLYQTKFPSCTRFDFIAWDLQQEKNPDSGATPFLQIFKSFLRNGCSRMSITDTTKIFRISFLCFSDPDLFLCPKQWNFNQKNSFKKTKFTRNTRNALKSFRLMLCSNPRHVQSICRWSASRNGVPLNCQKKMPARMFHRVDTSSGSNNFREESVAFFHLVILYNFYPFFFSLDTEDDPLQGLTEHADLLLERVAGLQLVQRAQVQHGVPLHQGRISSTETFKWTL